MEFVYLAINKRMIKDAVKIGRTSDVPKRMKELSSASGVIGKYVCLCSCATNSAQDARAVEKKLHEIFSDYRDEKEFFKVDWLVAAGVLITLVLEKERKGSASPELAKWLRRELLDDTVVIKPVPNGQKPKGVVDIERQRKNFMEYVKVKISAERATVCDGHIQYIDKEVLKSYKVYSIISIEQAEEIISKLPKRVDANTKKHRIIGMPAAMGHYVDFLRKNK